MKYKILLSLLVVSVLGCGVADAQYSSQKQTIATDVQEHLDYWKPVTDWIFSWKGLFFLGIPIFFISGPLYKKWEEWRDEKFQDSLKKYARPGKVLTKKEKKEHKKKEGKHGPCPMCGVTYGYDGSSCRHCKWDY